VPHVKGKRPRGSVPIGPCRPRLDYRPARASVAAGTCGNPTFAMLRAESTTPSTSSPTKLPRRVAHGPGQPNSHEKSLHGKLHAAWRAHHALTGVAIQLTATHSRFLHRSSWENSAKGQGLL
jgi:hypothetical protein